jgi:NitT/TauT family transport system substrate-binding protein
MKNLKAILIAATISLGITSTVYALTNDDREYTIAFSHYTGWEPWAYIHEFGLMDKWNTKYRTNVNIEFYNDYGASLDMMTSGQIDGVTATNMDALLAPAAGGIEMISLINGDYSNGNDALVVRGGTTCSNIKGKEVLLFEGTVSHFLLNKYLVNECNLTLDDVEIKNTSDADIAATYLATEDVAAVAWNPPLQVILSDPATEIVYSSADIPGFILDSLYVRADMSEDAQKALVGAWFEAISIMTSRGKEGREMIQFMAKYSGAATPNEFKAQMRTTAFFVTPQQAVDFTTAPALKSITEDVRKFVWDTGLVSNNVKSPDHIGIKFPDGTVSGNPDNIKIHYNTEIMQLAADGKL